MLTQKLCTNKCEVSHNSSVIDDTKAGHISVCLKGFFYLCYKIIINVHINSHVSQIMIYTLAQHLLNTAKHHSVFFRLLLLQSWRRTSQSQIVRRDERFSPDARLIGEETSAVIDSDCVCVCVLSRFIEFFSPTRKILNELSSDSPAVSKIDEEKAEDEVAVSSPSAPTSIYQTSSGQYSQYTHTWTGMFVLLSSSADRVQSNNLSYTIRSSPPHTSCQ